MLTQEEISALMPQSETELSAFDIMLATDSMIYALDRGRELESEGVQIAVLRQHLEQFREALAEA